MSEHNFGFNATHGVEMLLGGFHNGLRAITEAMERNRQQEQNVSDYYYSNWVHAYQLYQHIRVNFNEIVLKYNDLLADYKAEFKRAENNMHIANKNKAIVIKLQEENAALRLKIRPNA
jgi:hypothetical protein